MRDTCELRLNIGAPLCSATHLASDSNPCVFRGVMACNFGEGVALGGEGPCSDEVNNPAHGDVR